MGVQLTARLAARLAAWQALFKTLYISGGVAGLDLFVKCIYIFALHVPLFLFGWVAAAGHGQGHGSRVTLLRAAGTGTGPAGNSHARGGRRPVRCAQCTSTPGRAARRQQPPTPATCRPPLIHAGARPTARPPT
jgi:hypothetical protein